MHPGGPEVALLNESFRARHSNGGSCDGFICHHMGSAAPAMAIVSVNWAPSTPLTGAAIRNCPATPRNCELSSHAKDLFCTPPADTQLSQCKLRPLPDAEEVVNRRNKLQSRAWRSTGCLR